VKSATPNLKEKQELEICHLETYFPIFVNQFSTFFVLNLNTSLKLCAAIAFFT